MPMYEYQCSACGGRFERLSWGEGAAQVRCGCGSAAVERIWYSRTAIGVAEGEAGFADSDGAADCGNPGGCCGGRSCAMGANMDANMDAN